MEAEFKNQLLIHNPQLYVELYEKPGSPLVHEEDRPEWFVPRSDEEIGEILSELRDMGFALGHGVDNTLSDGADEYE